MAFRLVALEAHAEDTGKTLSEVKAELGKLGISHIGGFFDFGALEAALAEPNTTNIKAKKKDRWTIAHTDGIGAIKHVADNVNLDIVRHLTRHSQFVTFRNAKGQRRQVKVYTTQRARGEFVTARFTLRGFLSENHPSHYLFMCYEGPRGWVMSHKQLVALHTKVLKRPDSSEIASISRKSRSHPTGAINLFLDAGEEALLFTSAKQIGL